MTDHVDRELSTALVAHAAVSVGLLYAPLIAAVEHGPPGEPLFGGVAALLAPLYYLCVFAVIVAPSVQSMRSSSEPLRAPETTLEDGPVGDLQRRYVEDEVSETEFEERLEKLLEE